MIVDTLNNKHYFWTKHIRYKMGFYGLSASRVLRVIRAPERIERGLVENTVVFMQPVSFRKYSKKRKEWSSEIWVMAKEQNKRLNLISAWRYPGRTKSGEPLPPEIIRELRDIGN